MNHRCLGREAKPSQPKRRRFWPRKRQKKRKEKKKYIVWQASQFPNLISSSIIVLQTAYDGLVSAAFLWRKKKEVTEQEGKKKKRIHTYFTCLERNGEIVAVFVIVVRRFDIRLCRVRIIRVIIKEKVYVGSKYVLHAVLLLHNVSFFLFTLDFKKFFTLIFSSTQCVKWLFSTFQPRAKKFRILIWQICFRKRPGWKKFWD